MSLPTFKVRPFGLLYSTYYDWLSSRVSTIWEILEILKSESISLKFWLKIVSSQSLATQNTELPGVCQRDDQMARHLLSYKYFIRITFCALDPASNFQVTDFEFSCIFFMKFGSSFDLL